jgi:hypothetical protein
MVKVVILTASLKVYNTDIIADLHGLVEVFEAFLHTKSGCTTFTAAAHSSCFENQTE